MSILLASLLAVAPQATVYNTGVTINDPAKAHPGWNIEISDLEAYHTQQDQFVHVRDMNGAILNSWSSPLAGWNIAELAKPLPNGNLLTMVYDKVNRIDRILVELDWAGNMVWMFDPNNTAYDLHHDFERRADGTSLAVSHRGIVNTSIITQGRVFDDVVLFINPSGANITRVWSTAAHYNQLELSEQSKAIIKALPGNGLKDIFHMNSVQTLPPNSHGDPRFAEGNVLVSLRTISKVLIFSPTDGNVTWVNPVKTLGQHHPRMIPPGFPGAGNILIFDNGGTANYPRECRLWSRVVEVDPVAGEVVWEYSTQDAPANSALRRSFFSNRISGAQRLANGNTLITQGDWGRMFEVEPDGTIVWEFQKSDYHKLYRGYRVDPAWQSSGLSSWIW